MACNMLFVSSVVLSCVLGSSGESYDNMTTLISTVLSGYNTYVRPLEDQSRTVKVNISLNLYNILYVDTVQGVVTLAMGLPCTWYDERIKWNASDYGGISIIKMQQHHVWTPALQSSQPVEFTSVGEEWMTVEFQSNGFASWNPAGVYKIACPMTIKHWPFDEQQCELRYFIYGVTDAEVLLEPGTIYTEFLPDNGEWSLESTSVSTQNIFGLVEAMFTVTLKRRVIFYTDTLIIPLFLLVFLNCFVFLLPSESGERITYCITILLSKTIFLELISDEIPKLSNPVPMLCQYLVYSVIMDALVTILVVLNIWLYHRCSDVPIGPYGLIIVRLARYKKRSAGVETTQRIHEEQISKSTRNTLVHKSEYSLRKAVVTNSGKDNTNDDTSTENKQIKKHDITWQDVSIAFDRILFIVTTTSSMVVIPIMILLLRFNI